MTSPKAHELLRSHFRAKQRLRRGLSVRSLAQKIQASPAFMSKMLAGAKPIPLKRVAALASALDLDPVARRTLERTILREQTDDATTAENLSLEVTGESHSCPQAPLPSAQFQSLQDRAILDEWYLLPILDLVTCDGFEPGWISERLGLKPDVAERAWDKVRARGWVELRDGRWQKIAEKIRFPAHRYDPAVSRHHQRMLKKAAQELTHKTSESDFVRRLILGASVATNDESFRLAEKYLEEALFKAADILSQGPADRLYYVSLQLFPLSREKK